jgi:hypothetical protein
MEEPAEKTLHTLLQVFTKEGGLQSGVVEEVYAAEGQDKKLCCEVLWQLTPEVR